MIIKMLFLPLGMLFGFLLSRAGATTYEYYAKLFLFQNLQLMWVMGIAAGVGMVGVLGLKKFAKRSLFTGQPISFEGKPYRKGLIAGSLLFGAGWGVAGACPGTALAMLGEGKLGALFTIVGISLGTFIFGAWQSRESSS